ncbi:MAG: helix-turn-helix transcriptional regulator [Lachnospiraceae bacterium]|nr:helix-turn-helix transcriptional regulator [Lachnospiraceae bacterium]
MTDNNLAAQQDGDDNAIDPRLGLRMREARKEQHMTIVELAQKVGCSHTHISRLENAQRRVDSMALLTALSDALNIPMEEMLSLAGQGIQKEKSLVRVAFPSLNENYQEQAVIEFAKLVSSGLTAEEIESMLTHAKAYAQYCINKNNG